MKKIMVLFLILSFVLSAVGVFADCDKPSSCSLHRKASIPSSQVTNAVNNCKKYCDISNNAQCIATVTPLSGDNVKVECTADGIACVGGCKVPANPATGGGTNVNVFNTDQGSTGSFTLFNSFGNVIDFKTFDLNSVNPTDKVEFKFEFDPFGLEKWKFFDGTGNIIGSVEGELGDGSNFENFYAKQGATTTGTGNFFLNTMLITALGAGVDATATFSTDAVASIQDLTLGDADTSGELFMTLGVTLSDGGGPGLVPEFSTTGIIAAIVIVAVLGVIVVLKKKKK